MNKDFIVKRINKFYDTPEVVRGSGNMILLGFNGDGDIIVSALRDCRDIIENVTEIIKYDYIGQRSFVEFSVKFKEGIAYDKEGNNWIDLDIDNLSEFLNNKVEAQRLIDGSWTTRSETSKPSIAYDIAEPTISSKYRYRIQENKEPIRITQEVLNVLRNVFVIMGTKEGLEEKLNRKVIIID